MPSLRSDVCVIPLAREHAALMSRWMLDPVVAQGIGLRDPEPSLEKTLAWVERIQSDPSVRALAIHKGGEHVGNVILDRLDGYLRSARLSIYVGEPTARGVGVGRTGLALAAKFAFEELHLHKIWLTVHAENVAAIASYLHVGFALEGILRDEFLVEGRRVAAIQMGLLCHEFAQRRERGGLT